MRRVLNVFMTVVAVLALVSLICEHGFYVPPINVQWLHKLQFAVLGYFLIDKFIRFLITPDRWGYLRHIWLHLVLIALIVGAILLAGRLGYPFTSAGMVYVTIVQVYILGLLGLNLLSLNVRLSESGLPPARLLIISFLAVIICGTALLQLPRALPESSAEQRIPIVDSLFTAVSATCVTGLVVRDTGRDFSVFGQIVILAMIQAGALGIMMFGTTFALMVGRTIGLREGTFYQGLLSENIFGKIARMLKFIILATLILELLGAVLLLSLWPEDFTQPQRIWYSVFHSISAFCNAGFGLFSDSLQRFAGSWQVYAVFCPLIIIGGLGFPVLYNVVQMFWASLLGCFRKKRHFVLGAEMAPSRPRFTLQTKLVATTSISLIVLGTIALFLLGSGSLPGAFFQSVTARTAGFNTIVIKDLPPGGLFLLITLMVVGGSPASTAGGFKTVTLAVLVLSVWATLRRRDNVEAFGRTLALETLRRAAALVILFLGLLVVTTLALSLAQPGESLAELLFESASACGTVGLSTGLTARLTTAGKYILMVAMFLGRLGPLTFLIAVSLRHRPARYDYPSEPLVIG
ncbi:MAG: hypothetical protein GWP14_08290 [Actinobacteria bacterium]|nr:hypothetical protein [Actinomycetota bacterium]